jgi:hypothetical protein
MLGPAIIPEPFPGFPHLNGRGCGKRIDAGKELEEPVVIGFDPGHLGLLQHELGYQNPVRISGLPPRQVSSISTEPAEEGAAERRRVRQRVAGGHERERYRLTAVAQPG